MFWVHVQRYDDMLSGMLLIVSSLLSFNDDTQVACFKVHMMTCWVECCSLYPLYCLQRWDTSGVFQALSARMRSLYIADLLISHVLSSAQRYDDMLSGINEMDPWMPAKEELWRGAFSTRHSAHTVVGLRWDRGVRSGARVSLHRKRASLPRARSAVERLASLSHIGGAAGPQSCCK